MILTHNLVYKWDIRCSTAVSLKEKFQDLIDDKKKAESMWLALSKESKLSIVISLPTMTLINERETTCLEDACSFKKSHSFDMFVADCATKDGYLGFYKCHDQLFI
ncbi:hypothetical protein Salat_2539700 [Sesamum alatum]|uniref:Uncharacterized protein n=1 Tax=Sesamum alatum TaxID=300844 RepID=A0AAE1XSG7_9LAMI|nr:hypothetical protein Salat_2539700 [Sesamum alatum]